MRTPSGSTLAAVTVAATVLALSTSTASGDSGAEQAKIDVEMTDLHNDLGNVKLAIWRTRAGFPEDETRALRRYQVPIVAGQAKLKIDHLEPGTWAIAAFHDENGNGKLDLGIFGIPKEGLGVSRDAKGFFGPPSFEASKLDVRAGEETQRFKIVYY